MITLPPHGAQIRLTIVQLGHLSDLIWTLPLIKTIKQAYPDISICLICDKKHHDIHKLHPEVTIRPIDGRSWLMQIKPLFTLFRSYPNHIVILTQGSFWQRLCLWLSRCPIRIGFGRSLFGLLSHSVSEPADPVHTIEKYLMLARPLLSKFSKNTYRLPVLSEKQRYTTDVSRYIRKFLHPQRKKILLLLTVSDLSDALLIHFWRPLITHLIGLSYEIMVIPPPDQQRRLFPDITDHLIESPYGESLLHCIDFITASDLVIGKNEGRSHLAAHCGTPLICLTERRHNSVLKTGPFSPYVVLISKDSLTDSLTKRASFRTFITMSSHLLTQCLQSVESCLNQKHWAEPLSLPEITQKHWFFSSQALYLIRSKADYAIAKRHLDTLRHDGLTIWPYYYGGFFLWRWIQLWRHIQKGSIAIVHGHHRINIPVWLSHCVTRICFRKSDLLYIKEKHLSLLSASDYFERHRIGLRVSL